MQLKKIVNNGIAASLANISTGSFDWIVTDTKEQPTPNSGYKKLAVQWLIEALRFVSVLFGSPKFY
jgi:hypothetical protein